MSRKSPPPRPPAPKMSSGGSLSFSFKALEEEDDEELTVFTGKFDKKVHEDKEKQSRAYERQRSASKSPAVVSVSERDTQSLSNSQKSLDKLKDLTGKFQDKLTKKASESRVKGKKDEDVVKENMKEISLNNWHDKTKEEKGASLDDHEHEDEFVDCKNEDGSFHSDINSADIVDSLEINEDYYDKDSKDFSDLPITETAVRQRKGFNKTGKIKPVKPSPQVTMSGLNQKTFNESHVKTASPSGDLNKNINYSNKRKDEEANLDINGANFPIKKLAASVIFLFIYIMFPLPSYISGMIAGIILSSGGWLLYLWVMEPSKPREPIPDDLPLDKLPPMPTPAMKHPKEEDVGINKGWMNEVIDYVPETYSINHTHSVFVHLEGTTLRLRRPKFNLPKRAMWDELIPPPQFIHQRHFDVQGSKILLLPPGLVKKRLWSKKYPICIALANAGNKPTGKQDFAGETTTESPSSVATGMSSSHSDDSVKGFEMVQEQKCDTGILYLFARTCHEKETWFRKLNAASKGTPWKNHILEIERILNSSKRQRRSSSSDSLKQKRQESVESLSSVSSNSPCTEDVPLTDIDLKDFVMYMSRLLPKDKDSRPSSPAHMGGQKDKQEPKTGSDLKSISGNGSKAIICDPVLLPINALLGRCFWDFLRDTYWSNKVKEKLQKKLSKIHIPYFIEELKISEIDLGTEVPVIRRTNKPFLDENGFWIDLDLTYSGKFKMTIETKVNLLKLKENSSKVPKEKSKEEQRSAVTDSEEEDSAESSSDEEDETSTIGEDGTAQSAGTGKKLLKYINKITASKYFQSATENKYIKKAMTGVSNTRLILTVELQKLTGTLAINIPVPPSDRLWYGFRSNPQLWLVAKPKVGEREVTMSHITEWIEKKLTMEFQHVLVMPNMDDFVIPILLPEVSVSEACSESHPHLGSEV